MDEDCPIIPFEGSYLGISDPRQTAPWIKEEDKIPLVLAVSIYGTPIPVLDSYALVSNSYKTRYAAWIDQTTRILIIACRGTSIGKQGGMQDLKDDTVSLFFIFQHFNSFT